MDEVSEFLADAGQFLSVFKQAKDLLPESKEKDEAAQALETAESSFKVAEAQLAQSMGFELCQCSWPPHIMLYRQELDEYHCSECGNAKTRLQPRRERQSR